MTVAKLKEVYELQPFRPFTLRLADGRAIPVLHREFMMAANHSLDEIRQYLNADSLHYLSQDGMVAATGRPRAGFCMACYDGNYPVAYDSKLEKNIMERRRARVESLGEAIAKDEMQARLL